MFATTPLSQQDPRWKNKRLGQDTITIGKWGCLLTCMTMVANGFGADETPETLNDKLKGAGGFIGALVIPAAMPRVVGGVRFVNYIPCENQPAPISEINATLAAGKPVIVEVDYSPAHGLQNHWVVLYDRKGDDYLIHDPWPFPVESKEVLLTARYGFAGSPKQIIQGAVFYDGVAVPQPPAPPPAPKPINDTGFAVYATADDLALRTQPFVGDTNLIKRVPLGTKFFVLEPAAQGRAKIGALNQWLNVQDAQEGYEGFVAAWYVVETQPAPPEAPPPVAPPPAPATGGVFKVYANADGLALRTQPVIADATLIKRLPLNAELVVLETESVARPKVGVSGQWLKVRDIEGAEGLAAAWYVSLQREDPALGVGPVQPPAKLVVRATTDLLALRSQPVIAADTLIKRLPINAELLVVEPAEQAEKKIGVVNQWMKVRDSEGAEGYVAAWYVIKRPAPGGG